MRRHTAQHLHNSWDSREHIYCRPRARVQDLARKGNALLPSRDVRRRHNMTGSHRHTTAAQRGHRETRSRRWEFRPHQGQGGSPPPHISFAYLLHTRSLKAVKREEAPRSQSNTAKLHRAALQSHPRLSLRVHLTSKALGCHFKQSRLPPKNSESCSLLRVLRIVWSPFSLTKATILHEELIVKQMWKEYNKQLLLSLSRFH